MERNIMIPNAILHTRCCAKLGAVMLGMGLLAAHVLAQGTVVDPLTVGPTTPGWESDYQNRVNTLVNAQSWTIGNGEGDTDVGKRDWPALLAEMWKVRNDPAAINNFISGKGRTLLFSTYAGSFYKPFSNPGYTKYYFQYKNLLSLEQRDRASLMINSGTGTSDPKLSGWTYMTREDGHMDPIYPLTEFNSENFNWMARLMGYLWAEEYGNQTRLNYFRPYVDNWVRAMYNAGRVEWNSNTYWGYTFQPALVLYDHAQDPVVKRQAKAALDWMVMESSLHYLDGFQAGPDSRAKSNAHMPFSGSTWTYSHLYFIDAAYHPTYSDAGATAKMDKNLVGWFPYTSYRPPQVLIDIAQRKFALPLEMRNAKPFYHLDFDNYADWKGNTTRSRRFEFETVYMDQNYILASVATHRPDGSIGTFSEQNLWRLGVKGSNNGAIHLMGNAGADNDAAGRNPFEEIGQYRNAMMRMIKGADRLWVGFPKFETVEISGNRAFADMGNGVYVALSPYNSTGRSQTTLSTDTSYNQFIWTYSSSQLGALVMEVGTVGEHGSYSQFKSAITNNTSFFVPGIDQLEYTSTAGRKLKMEFMPTTSYTMVDGTVVNPAGVVPKVWMDGVFADFSQWNTYEVTYGEQIVSQDWGSGVLKLSANGKSLDISVDPVTAEVEYRDLSSGGNVAPKVSLIDPMDGSVFPASSNILLAATASDSDGTVSKVEFYQGSTKLGEDLSSPYGYTWTNAPSGTHTLTAKAIDNAGGSAFSNSVQIIVNTPPTVSIASPANGAAFTAPADITIQANASDVDGSIAKVEFFVQDNKVGEDAVSPYSFTLSGAEAGSYALTAKATDDQGASTVTSTVTVTVSEPSSWSSQDIGVVGATGSHSESGGVHTIKGSGGDIWGSADAFRFVYLPLTGDGEITARVATLQNTHSWAKSGVMIRESLATNSRHASMVLTPGNGVSFQRRVSTGGSSSSSSGGSATAPYWVRIKRQGNVFSAWKSSNGSFWTQVGSNTSISMASKVYIGLALTSHKKGTLCTSTLDNVQVPTVVSQSSNQAPSTNAGADQTITLPANSISLAGTASDDGLPNPPGALSITWSKISGPGTVTFANANALSTTVSFSTSGSYVLRLSAYDGELTATDDIGVTVNPEPSGSFSVKVNFQSSGSALPSGYLADAGAAYGSRGNGQTYGWNAANNATRQRTHADQRYATLNHMQKSGAFTWELAIPNGTYTVKIVAGDAGYYDSVFKINAEGVLAVSGTPSNASRFVEGTVSVTVSDGKLTISNASGASNNKICFIDITSP